MKLRDVPASFSRIFGKDNADFAAFVDPLQNVILDNTVFVKENGSPAIATAAYGSSCVFVAPLAGPFYDLNFVGLTLNYTRPINFRLPRSWKPVRVLAEDDKGGTQCTSAIVWLNVSVNKLNDLSRENGIKWYDRDEITGTVVFEGLKTYVQWLKGKNTQGGSTPLR